MQVAREQIQLSEGHSFRLLRWGRSLREVECLLSAQSASPVEGVGTRWHFHLEMELTLFTSGEGTRFVGDHIGAFTPGDLVLLGEKLPHYWHTHGRSSGLSLQWHFPKDHPFWAFPENAPLVDLFGRAGRGLHISGGLACDVVELLKELPFAGGPKRLALLMQLLARLGEGSEKELTSLSLRSFSLAAGSQHQSAIADAVRHLIANFRDEICLEDVLRLTKMSRPTFSRQFKEHSGRTFSEFLKSLRLQAACRELEEGSASILDVALSSGFTQISFFNRLFQKTFSCSPSQYRARLSKGSPPLGRLAPPAT